MKPLRKPLLRQSTQPAVDGDALVEAHRGRQRRSQLGCLKGTPLTRNSHASSLINWPGFRQAFRVELTPEAEGSAPSSLVDDPPDVT